MSDLETWDAYWRRVNSIPKDEPSSHAGRVVTLGHPLLMREMERAAGKKERPHPTMLMLRRPQTASFEWVRPLPSFKDKP